jgi:hypothetical protein
LCCGATPGGSSGREMNAMMNRICAMKIKVNPIRTTIRIEPTPPRVLA